MRAQANASSCKTANKSTTQPKLQPCSRKVLWINELIEEKGIKKKRENLVSTYNIARAILQVIILWSHFKLSRALTLHACAEQLRLLDDWLAALILEMVNQVQPA